MSANPQQKGKRGEQGKLPLSISVTMGLALFATPVAVAAIFAGLLFQTGFFNISGPPPVVPPQAQLIDQKSFNVLPTVLPPAQSNGSQPFIPPGLTAKALKAKPFHIYDNGFYAVLGPNPTLTLLAHTDGNPLFHEAVVWSKGTDEVFFVQNAGAKAAGTGLEKSSIIQKISLAEAISVSDMRNASGLVTVTTVDSTPMVINPNGATNYRGQLLFAGEGQGDTKESALWIMNPRPPYNTTLLVNNFFGRQFNSLNDLAVHPVNRDVYFTDTLYGYLQDFRPTPGMRNQVYRLNDVTGALTVVADGFVLPNGITFSPDGAYAYVTDTGLHHGYYGFNYSDPASIYRFDVKPDGTFENRKTFAYVDSGVPDGVHCDASGNVYAACGDGLHVWSPAGVLLGKVHVGGTVANFQFAGAGRLVLCAETELYLATLAAEDAYIEEYHVPEL